MFILPNIHFAELYTSWFYLELHKEFRETKNCMKMCSFELDCISLSERPIFMQMKIASGRSWGKPPPKTLLLGMRFLRFLGSLDSEWI